MNKSSPKSTVNPRVKRSTAMASAAALLALLAAIGGADAWGALFNRFNPALHSNLGYGGSYGKDLYGVSHQVLSKPSIAEEMADADEGASSAGSADDDDDPCVGRACFANEGCCDGHVCVDTGDEGDYASTEGTCLPIFGKKQGESCFRDNDCESGFLCVKDGSGERSCQAPVPGRQELGEDCRTSSDCNTHKNLCCRLIRRARSQPKKICSYYSSPSMCIGPVASTSPFSLKHMEHTAGEKRISPHPDYHHLRR